MNVKIVQILSLDFKSYFTHISAPQAKRAATVMPMNYVNGLEKSASILACSRPVAAVTFVHEKVHADAKQQRQPE